MQKFLNYLLDKKIKGARVVHHSVFPARKPRYGSPQSMLPEVLRQALCSLGINKLYAHQAAALDAVRAGKHVVVATPTASGKSLIYNMAVVESLISSEQHRALYLFPIKALSRDQLGNLRAVLNRVQPAHVFQAAVYDGDTSSYQRSKLRQSHPHILLSNPDMLHYALLPYHAKWEAFWKKLRFVVVDEMHAYRGVFGSHVAQIFRRLQRICRYYGSAPQFILLSATIANPRELGRHLIDQDVEVIEDQGSPQSKRHMVFLETEGTIGGIAARLLIKAASRNLKTIVFTQSRRLTELVHMSVIRAAPRLASKVSSYRAGFLPEERRNIEQQLASGDLAAVISTSALEMGIDIGGLDVCIMAGYPGTIMNTWQRGGRVGRSGQESAIILIPQQDALDQFIIHHPEHFLHSGYEAAVADPNNVEILKAHLPCAAAELPLSKEEVEHWNPSRQEVVKHLTETGVLLQTFENDQWLSRSMRPHWKVDIRTVGPAYAILTPSATTDEWIPLGKSEGARALKECHPGAIYLHRGNTYEVADMDLKKRVIRVKPCRSPYLTRIKSEKETEILDLIASKPAANFLIRLGRLRVTEYILGYEKRRLFNQELLDFNLLDLPPQVFETVGFWLEIEPAVAARIQAEKLHFMGGIHALEHAMISMFPLFTVCDRNDIGGISIPHHPQIGKGAIFIYDGYPGGIGLASKGYEMIVPLLEKTKELIAECSCSDGCPACIHSPKCGAGNKPLDKLAALHLLHYLLGEWPLPAVAEGKNIEPIASVISGDEENRGKAPRIGFFDLETQRLANEVGGWANKHLMRVSVAVVYELPEGKFHVYREDDIDKLIAHLQQLDLVVGFNIKNFDYGVLKAYTSLDFSKLLTFDILESVQQVLGFRLSLDHLASQTLGHAKVADGIQAVRWYRAGQWEPLTRYCKEDVRLTHDLFQHALEKGYLVYRNRQGRKLKIPTPWNLEVLLNSETKSDDSRQLKGLLQQNGR